MHINFSNNNKFIAQYIINLCLNYVKLLNRTLSTQCYYQQCDCHSDNLSKEKHCLKTSNTKTDNEIELLRLKITLYILHKHKLRLTLCFTGKIRLHNNYLLRRLRRSVYLWLLVGGDVFVFGSSSSTAATVDNRNHFGLFCDPKRYFFILFFCSF